jgi:RNA polymerase sigma-70 factor (ECF subfamily)
MTEGYAELVRNVVGGGAPGRDAEAELCRAFAPRIRLYGLRHLRDEDRAADLVQVVLMATVEAVRAGRVDDPLRLDRFVLGTCRNTVSRMRERDARTVAHAPGDLDLGATDPAEVVETDALFRCLSKLDARARLVLQLTFEEDRSTGEIANVLALSVANVRVVRHRAIAQVRACLDRGVES